MNVFPTFLVLALSSSLNHIRRENQQIPFSTAVSHRGMRRVKRECEKKSRKEEENDTTHNNVKMKENR